jgi:hypothetical protein
MQAAQRILFMGFGYNRINMKRLELANFVPGKMIGTSLGLGARDKSIIHKEIGERKLELIDKDCMYFAQELIPWT